MNNIFRKKTAGLSKLGIVLLSTAIVSACGSASATQDGAGAGATAVAAKLSTGGAVSSVTLVKRSVADLVTFDAEDKDTSWSASSSTQIALSGTGATVKGNGAKAQAGKVTISTAGTYVLSGKLSDGQIVVDVQDKGNVRLVLNGVDLHNNDSAAIYVKAAGKVIVALQEGTENVVSDGDNYVYSDASTDEPNAAIFSKADLTINGTGKLSVTGNYNNGISSKDDLKIVSGSIEVQTKDDAVLGRDMVAVQDVKLTVTAGGDGIKSTNDSDAEKGFVAIAGGSFDIKAGSDGIQAETSLVTDGGTYSLVTGGGNTKAEVKVQDNGRGGPWEKNASTTPSSDQATDQTQNSGTDSQSTDSESQSAKGLKAKGDVIVNGGSFTLDTKDDAIHSNSNVGVLGGEMKIAAGDDGIHADTLASIAGGTVDITGSYEGIEGADITISGGKTHVTSSDDGVNVSGGSDAAATTEGGQEQDQFSDSGTNLLTISGGYLSVDAGGDGLDSNGSAKMSGGTAIVNGPTSDGNAALDYNGTFEISGGVLAVAGSSGMAQAPSDGSSQYSIIMNYPQVQQAGTLVHLQDSQGKDIMTFAPSKNYQSIVISSPNLKKGSYTLYSGGTSTGSKTDGMYGANGKYTGGTKVVAFEISSVATWLNESGVTTAGSGTRGPGGGGMRGGRGGKGVMGQKPTDGQAPADGQAPTGGQAPTDAQAQASVQAPTDTQ